ncbi:MAG: lipid A phosphoethanolamine transferase [Saccharospirillaceae bacterium]|nr:lipid A phosphoethanolamine transferase [Saccharospirillaceae bacterium]MCD8533217.1 lipid A phosphoethanolamine transferase [Saccharospirillaceae bacterium]
MNIKYDRSNSLLNNPLLWCSLLLLYPLLNEVIFSDFVREGEYNSRIGWSFITALLITLTNKRWITAFVLLPFAIGGTADIGYAYSFGGVFTTATMEAVANTDSYEVSEYIRTYSSWQQTLLLTVLWSIYVMAVYFSKTPNSSAWRKTILILGSILILVVVYRTTVMGKYHDTIPGVLGTLPSYYKGSVSVQHEIALRKSLRENKEAEVTLSNPQQPQTHVFIIGESATRNHMGIYGYHRDTTPVLDSLRTELAVLTNVISSHVQTQASLRVALTAAASADGEQYRESLSIIDVAGMAGYKTFWISNQQPQRATIASISYQADVTHYISNDFNGVEVRRFDEYMLDRISSAIKDPAPLKVIFIHMMGSHAAYENRYPDEFSQFRNDEVTGYRERLSNDEIETINAYDNSILYSDHFIGNVLSLLKDHTESESTLTYFSDHGEEVFQTARVKGHTPDNLTAAMMEIPLIMWSSTSDNAAFQSLKANRDQPFMLDDLFHLAMTIMGIQGELINDRKSPASEYYQPPATREVYHLIYEERFQNRTGNNSDIKIESSL